MLPNLNIKKIDFLCICIRITLRDQLSPFPFDGVAEPAPDNVIHLPHPGSDAEPLRDVGLLRLRLKRYHSVQQGVPEGHEEGAISTAGGSSSSWDSKFI